MQLLKWFSLMKEVVMCNENLKLKSPLKVNSPLLNYRNFDFAFFRGGGGGGGGEGLCLENQRGGGKGGTCEVLQPCNSLPPNLKRAP